MTEVKRITLESADKLIGQDHVVLLDMRDVRSFKCGHIEGAINLSDFNVRTILKQFNKDLTVIVYCYHGNSSRDMSVLFTDFGFKHCFSMDGGYEGWMAYQQEKKQLTGSIQSWMTDAGFNPLDIESRSYNGETALMYAAREGKTEYLIQLIDYGADIDAKNYDGNSAVWLACFNGNPNTLEVLIEEGANLNLQNDNGATPLIYAASAGREQMVRMLLAAGADYGKQTLDGFSALDVAATLPILKHLRSVRTFAQA